MFIGGQKVDVTESQKHEKTMENTTYLTPKTLYASLPFDSGQATLFVREKGVSRTTNFEEDDSGDDNEPQSKKARISGKEARQFYEDVLLMPKESRTNEGCSKRQSVKGRINVKRRRKRETSNKSHVSVEIASIAQLFLSVQEGDLETLKSALSGDFCDINVVDNFNWTLLMCAAHAGHMTIVRYLLEQGADWHHHTDRRGNNAADLARISGHPNIAEFIESHTGTHRHSLAAHVRLCGHSHSHAGIDTCQEQRHTHSNNNYSSTADKSAVTQSSFYCDVCKMNVGLGTSTVSKHTTSTVHQFSCQHKPIVTPYGIPESNRGFQLLLKGGWDPEKGLGPDQKGQKFPVKTVLKQDRLGFGLSSRARPRVTHFSAHDEAAVKTHRERSGVLGKQKAQPKKKGIVKAAERSRRWEIRMRRYMNSDYDLPA